MVESILLAATRVSTFAGLQSLTSATGFFFERGERLFLITSRHVVFDERTEHRPDRVELTIHVDTDDLTRARVLSLPLYASGKALWRQGRDSGGEVDVAAIELDRAVLPATAVIHCFGPDHLQRSLADLEVGTPIHIAGFPLGFYDTVHSLPVVRYGAIASAFGVRFQGEGYFLTDARTHRGMSGAPVVVRTNGSGPLPWKLLGVHASGFDMRDRDREVDESLGLNIAWYADILTVLTN
jgi:hypothetical protein